MPHTDGPNIFFGPEARATSCPVPNDRRRRNPFQPNPSVKRLTADSELVRRFPSCERHHRFASIHIRQDAAVLAWFVVGPKDHDRPSGDRQLAFDALFEIGQAFLSKPEDALRVDRQAD
jgi:hypothetical protein